MYTPINFVLHVHVADILYSYRTCLPNQCIDHVDDLRSGKAVTSIVFEWPIAVCISENSIENGGNRRPVMFEFALHFDSNVMFVSLVFISIFAQFEHVGMNVR